MRDRPIQTLFYSIVLLGSVAAMELAPLEVAAAATKIDAAADLRLEDESPTYLDGFARRLGVTCDPQSAKNLGPVFEKEAYRALYHLFLARRCGREESAKSADYYRGLAFYRAGDMAKAENYLNRSIKAGFESTVAHFYLGRSRFKLADYDGAISALEKVVKAKTDDAKLKRLANDVLVLAKASKEADKAAAETKSTPKKVEVTKKTSEIVLVPYGKKSPRKKLSDIGGKTTILNFWASWCVPCIKEFPELLAFYEQYREQGLALITVSQDDKRSSVTRFLKKWSLPKDLAVFYDQGGRLMEALSLPLGLPTTVLFDSDGVAIKVSIGLTDWQHEEFVSLVEHALGED